jgi:hypothetical protein
MCDKDKSESANCPGYRKARGGGELLPIIIPEVKALFILLEMLNKGIPVLNNVFMFVTINIHTILLPPIPPSQPFQPTMCHVLRNSGLFDTCKLEPVVTHYSTW